MAARAGAVPRPGDDSSPIYASSGLSQPSIQAERRPNVCGSASHRRGGMDHSNPTTGPSATFRTAVCAVLRARARTRRRLTPPCLDRGSAFAARRPSSIARSARRAPTLARGRLARARPSRSRRGLNAHVGSATVGLASRSAAAAAGSATQRRHAHHELRERVDPLRDQPRRAVPDGRAPPGNAHVELAARRDSRHAAIDRRRRELRTRRSAQGFHILPVAILDQSGRDITPGRALVARASGSGWTLGLRLDDSTLPVPYLIDPIALIAACALPAGPGGTTSCTAARSTGSSSLGIAKPSAAVSGDALVAQLTVRSTGAITPPAGWTQIGTTAQDAAGPIEQAVFWHRVDGTEPSPSRSRGRAATPTRRAGSSRTRASIRSSASTRAEARRPRCRAAAPPRWATRPASPSRPRRQTRCCRPPTASRTASPYADRRPGARPGVDRPLHRWRESTGGVRDGVQAAAGASGNKTATWVTSSLSVAHLFALKNEAADGSGTATASVTAASASRTGLTQTLTYTPAAGSMANGDVSFVVPAGWTAPQATTASAAGYVTATGGSGTNTIAVTGAGPWTVTVSGVTLEPGRRADTRHQVRRHERRRSRRDRARDDGRRRLDDEATLVEPRRADERRGAADDHRLRSRRDRHGRVESLGGLRFAGGVDRDAHLHGTRGRPLQRDVDRRRAGRVDITRDRGRTRLHDVLGRSRLRRGANDHRHRRDPHTGQTVVITYGSGATATAAAGPAHRAGRSRRPRPRAAC